MTRASDMSQNVVFVAPFPSEATMRFVRAVAALDDVKLLGVVHAAARARAALVSGCWSG